MYLLAILYTCLGPLKWTHMYVNSWLSTMGPCPLQVMLGKKCGLGAPEDNELETSYWQSIDLNKHTGDSSTEGTRLFRGKNLPTVQEHLVFKFY